MIEGLGISVEGFLFRIRALEFFPLQSLSQGSSCRVPGSGYLFNGSKWSSNSLGDSELTSCLAYFRPTGNNP